MNSDISRRINVSGESKSSFARTRTSSVFPVPVGPTKMNDAGRRRGLICTRLRRIAADGIVYIEAVKRRAQILIHMAEETVTAYGTLSRFEAEYPALFLRVHEGFLVNPNRVRGVRRFFLTMSDGTDIPVPEKKYTRVKKMLMR